MNNSIANWLRLRALLLRLFLFFGLVFSLACIYGPFTTHLFVRAGQPQEEKKKEEVRPKPEAPPGVDRAEAEKNKKIIEDGFGLTPPWEVLKPPVGVTKLPPFEPPRKPGKISLAPPPPTHVSGSQIQIPTGLQGLDLRAVHRINDRFLLDIPALDRSQTRLFRHLPIVSSGLKEQFSNTSVITAAKLPDGTEVLTVFDMHSSFDTGRLDGRVEVLPKDTDNRRRVRKIVGERGRGARVFFYGDDLHNIDLASIANDTGVELIRRTNKMRDLVSVQQRLNTIATRGFDPQNAVVVNGLPASPEAVESMGSFAGRAEKWLDFRESIESIIPANAKTTSAKNDFFQKLQQDDSELFVLVAHSDGLYFYLNGSRVSLKGHQRTA